MLLILFIKDPYFYQEKVKEQEILFLERVGNFSEFKSKKENVNLILGSSMIRDWLIPDSLGSNWYSFCNEGQNIYESFVFLNFFENSVKIDTVLIGLSPFDFPNSYKNNRNNEQNSQMEIFLFLFQIVLRI